MKIAMMGAGGVGGFFGGLLAQAGYEVGFVARGAHLAALQAHGLTIENETSGDIHIPRVRATDNPATLGPVDIVILSVKLWDTAEAAQTIRPLVGPRTGIMSLQNGVTKDDILRHEYGAAAVMGGVCYLATHIARPGVIHQTGAMQRLILGDYGGGTSTRTDAFFQALRHAGIQAELSPDIAKAIWEKFVFLVGLSATTTTMRATIGPIRANAQARAFLLAVMREAVAVGRVHGIALPEDYAESRLSFADGLPTDMTSSMYRDLERGNRLEVDWLSGSVVELGAKWGIPTPANRAVCAILALHAAGGSVRPSEPG